MKFEGKDIYNIMSAFHTIGDVEYGGSGTREEDILVGYIYGILSKSPESILKIDMEDRKVYKYGDHSYIVWFNGIGTYGDLTNDYDRFEVEIEDLSDAYGKENEYSEELGNSLFPIAIEGPYTDNEIANMISMGDL